MPITAREAAFRSLIKCENAGSYSNLEIDSKINKYGLEGAERALYTVLVYGVIERRIALDLRLKPLVNGGFERLDDVVKVILRIGAYQILHLDRVPDSAAVDEAVKTARRHAPAGAHNLVNAVLRSLCRTLNDPPELPDDPVLRLEATYSIPRGIIELWIGSYGAENAKKILDGLDARSRDVTVRVNTLKTTRDELARTMGGVPFDDLPDAIAVDCDPDALRTALESGLCYVQDISSQRAVQMLDPRSGDTVADVCCCPGGKSFACALAMRNVGEIRAFDLHANKLSLVERTASRLGITIIATAPRDAREPDPALVGRCDRVVCDVPCSGLGVIAKKPEIRYKPLGDIARLPQLQYDILRASASYLKVGGRLLYSTCTLNRAENEEVVARFLSENSAFSLCDERTFFPDRLADGFYAAVLCIS